MDIDEIKKQAVFKFTMPINSSVLVTVVKKPKNKRPYKTKIPARLNLNEYKSWHYQVKSMVVKAYYNDFFAINGVQSKPIGYRVSVYFVLYTQSKREVDRANILCVHDKFACDAMVKAGYLIDDNDKHIRSTTYLTGGVDKENPRVEIYLMRAQ